MGKGRGRSTAWDRKVKPAGLDSTKDEEPVRVDPHLMRRHFKRDALAQDRAIGCRCMNVKARFVPPPPDAEPGTISVLTWPHQPGCIIYQTRRQAEIQNTPNGPMRHTADVRGDGQVGGSSPNADYQEGVSDPTEDLTIMGSKGLWVPGAD